MRSPLRTALILPALASAAMLAGCGGGDESPAARSGGEARSSVPARGAADAHGHGPGSVDSHGTAAADERLPRWRTLRFRSSDGVRLHGRYTPPRRPGAPGVVLVHQLRGGPREWDPLVPKLHRAGYATLAYASRSAAELDETVLARDVAGAVAALRRRPEVDRRRIGLVGASIGATTVAWVLGRDAPAAVRAGVGLSPVESPALISAGMKGRYRPHDLLLIADRREITNSRSIRADAHGRGVALWTAPVIGHGVALLPNEAAASKLLAWLRARL